MIKEFKVGKYYRIKYRGIYQVVEIDKSNPDPALHRLYLKCLAGGGWLDASCWGTCRVGIWRGVATEIKKKDLVLEILKESD